MSAREALPRNTPPTADKRPRSRVSASKARERILFVCAALILLFAPSDVYALGHFSWSPLIVRLEWAGAVVVTVLALRRVEPHGVPIILNALAILSTVLYGALAQMTGGASSPLFHWILALPIVVALILPDLPGAAIGCGVTLVIHGAVILHLSGEPVTAMVRWMAQAVVVTSLVYALSATYRRLRIRETPPPDVQDVAAARVRASEAAVAARDEFLAVAAHELRTPLTSMLLHIEAIERTLPLEAAPESTLHVPPSEQKRIAAVARQARRLSGLIDSMLDVSKLTGGHLSLELGDVDVTALVRDVVQRFQPDATAAGCPLTLRLDQPIVCVLDAARIDQIVTNLVANALKYGAGAPVEIGVEGDEQVIRFTVRDHGIGISPADQQRIFRRFERAADERQYAGAGLGLWITSELVKALGGRITVHSTPGAGASFTVVLPRRPSTLVERRRSARHPASG
ncbi:MAG TPA: HAMP domain-containing sensor histidine kinase [Polyangia bacterium]|jgi:signal transduction histidine kinase|nr:HAMP domain-containing sensor histidine kinase [Polyangia bacterium]